MSENINVNPEIHLKCGDDVFRLPVLPSVYNVEGTNIINVENIPGKGEVSIYGGKSLRTIELSSFFPSKNYSFNAYKDVPKPYDCVAKIKKWFEGGYVIRLIITDTDINIPVFISSFTYGREDGTGDVVYTIGFQESVKIEIVENKPQQNDNKPRPEPEKKPEATKRIHTVKKGDSMWDIAQKYYGNGKVYKKINEANWNKYPSLKTNNIIYVNWQLVIP